MLHAISWKYFLSLLLAIAGFYWLVILFIFYRFSFVSWIHNSLHGREVGGGAARKHAETENGRMKDGELEILFPEVYALIEELKHLFAFASEKGFPKEELILALQLKLREHVKFIGTAFQQAVNNFIEVSARDSCSIGLEPAELNLLWPR
jgi:hypothetical protein